MPFPGEVDLSNFFLSADLGLPMSNQTGVKCFQVYDHPQVFKHKYI